MQADSKEPLSSCLRFPSAMFPSWPRISCSPPSNWTEWVASRTRTLSLSLALLTDPSSPLLLQPHHHQHLHSRLDSHWQSRSSSPRMANGHLSSSDHQLSPIGQVTMSRTWSSSSRTHNLTKSSSLPLPTVPAEPTTSCSRATQSDSLDLQH